MLRAHTWEPKQHDAKWFGKTSTESNGTVCETGQEKPLESQSGLQLLCLFPVCCSSSAEASFDLLHIMQGHSVCLSVYPSLLHRWTHCSHHTIILICMATGSSKPLQPEGGVNWVVWHQRCDKQCWEAGGLCWTGLLERHLSTAGTTDEERVAVRRHPMQCRTHKNVTNIYCRASHPSPSEDVQKPSWGWKQQHNR